jgi:hypothetical protein
VISAVLSTMMVPATLSGVCFCTSTFATSPELFSN